MKLERGVIVTQSSKRCGSALLMEEIWFATRLHRNSLLDCLGFQLKSTPAAGDSVSRDYLTNQKSVFGTIVRIEVASDLFY